MPPDNRGLSWTEIRDFTPGIYSAVNPSGAPPSPFPTGTPQIPSGAPPGAADETGTFRCCPGVQGGLTAVPGPQAFATLLAPGSNLVDPVTPPVYVTGFFVRGASTFLHYPTLADYTADDVIVYMTECVSTPPGHFISTGYEMDLRYQFPNIQTDFAVTDYVKTTGATVFGFFGAPYIGQQLLSQTGAFANALFPSIYVPWRNADQNNTDLQRLWVIDDLNTALHPTAVNILTNATGPAVAGATFGHQGRIVWAGEELAQSTAFGAVPFLLTPMPVNFLTNENFNYTDPPESNIPLSEGHLEGVIFWPENPSNYGAAVSISAGELFLIKMAGGAVYISGDLNNPNAIYYPGVQSTGKFFGHAASTTIGAVYCSQGHGAWSWNGGNTAQKISPQLRDDFYTVPTPIPFSTQFNTTNLEQSYGNFIDHFGFYVCSWGDWILFSNNWIYDIPTNGWWRLEDPSRQAFFWYGVSSTSSTFYACPCAYDPTLPQGNSIVANYSRFYPSPTYQWRSLPFRVTEDKRVQVRRVLIRGMTYLGDPSTITVTLYDEYGDAMTTGTVAFQPDNTGPQSIIFDVGNIKYSANITISVLAASSNAFTAAPDIQSISIGWRAMEQEVPTR